MLGHFGAGGFEDVDGCLLLHAAQLGNRHVPDGQTNVFDGWVQNDIARFDATRADGMRWIDVYTATGGTDANSRTMSASAQMWLNAAGLSASYFDDNTTSTLPPAAYAHPVIFKLSGLAHGDVPKYYFGELARASGFASLP